MAKLRLYPSAGTLQDAKLLKFEISDVGVDSFRVHMENATHGSRIDVNNFQDMGDGSHMGIVDLNIPSYSSQSAISIFAHVEEKQSDGSYSTVQICPTIFTIKEEAEKEGDILVSPSFISPDNLCSVSVKGKSNSKVSISINDKIFKVYINESGKGSVHFRCSDVMSGISNETVSQLPVYLYKEDDNYTNKIFSGSYINVLPSTISMYADPLIDPRCDEDNTEYYVEDPGTWVQPPECSGYIPPGDEPIEPVIPPTALPTDCLEENVDVHADICKIFGADTTMLNSGVALHAYISPDTTYQDPDDDKFNINRIFLTKHKSSLLKSTIANRDVVIEPKESGEEFRIHVENDLWQALVDVDNTSATDIYVVLFSSAIGFQRIKIVDRVVEEYIDSNVLIGEMEGDNLQINSWIFCVSAVFYHAEQQPSTYLSSYVKKLPYITDAGNNYVQITHVSITTNISYVSQYENTYVYIVAEGITNGESQLFFYAIDLSLDATMSTNRHGWEQLTSNGDNQNPKISMTSDHNLHVIWESDREDNIRQLYYGVLGLSYIPCAVAALSSFVDKYSNFLASGDEPFDYLTTVLKELAVGDEYSPIPEYDSESLVGYRWDIFTSDGGSVSEVDGDSYIRDLLIVANAVKHEAIAFTHLMIVGEEDDPSNIGLMPYSQYNYQVSFNLSAKVAQASEIASGDSYDGVAVNNRDINDLYSGWKNDFVASVGDGIDNQPVYIKNSNKYIIGRRDNIFDKIVPMVGSYEYNATPLSDNPSDNPSTTEDPFKIKILKNDSNLKDFTLGLMFEKSYFTATNIETLAEFEAHGYSDTYWPSEIHTIYSGRAKLVALIKTEETTVKRADYIIVREFPEVFDVSSEHNYTIIVNYTSIDSNEVETMLDTYEQIYSDKFIGVVTLLIDGVPRFSQSFISTISSDYNYFDIGFGVPYGGYYVADKMAPSKLGVFDDSLVTMTFTDISITSPTWIYNDEVINVPSAVHDSTSLRVQPGSPVTGNSSYLAYNSNMFLQVPLTLSGINQSADICNGNCDDVHIAWQSNRDRHWNIFYSNSSNKLSPFRRDTQITDTESNSLKPSVSVARNGTRMITWHDNRNSNYEIFVARSLDGYVCDHDKCERKMLDAFEDEILECTLSSSYSPVVIGTYNFAFEFYHDAGLTDLYKYISISDAPDRWYVDGVSIENSLEYNTDGTIAGFLISPIRDMVVSYIPDKDDDIFDMVLYANLTASVT